MCSYFMETIKQFENLTQLNKFKKENKGKLAMEWIDIKKQMPENKVVVLGYYPTGDEWGNKVATAITYNGKTLRSDFPNSTAHCFEATHWMPIPEPPSV